MRYGLCVSGPANLAAVNDLTGASHNSGVKMLIGLALCMLMTLPAWVRPAYASAPVISPTLPAPLLPRTTDEWQALRRGTTLVDVRKMAAGDFHVRGTALIEGTRRDLAWCLLRHGESFARWIPGVVNSQLLHAGPDKQVVQFTTNYLFVSARMTYLRTFKPFSAVTWQLLHDDARVDDGAWFIGPVMDSPPDSATSDVHSAPFYLLHYVSVTGPDIRVPAFVLRAIKNRLLPRQIEALRQQLASLTVRYPDPIPPASAPCPASLL